jgi:hypothetical protein
MGLPRELRTLRGEPADGSVEGLKRLGGDEKGIGCAVLQLSPDTSTKPQRDVWLLALSKRGNLVPSDPIGQAV